MTTYCADLETTTDPDDCRVWEWGCMELDEPDNYYRGLSLADAMETMLDLSPAVIYFHNLKFDGTFLLGWLLGNGWKYRSHELNKQGKYKKIKLKPGEFTSIISDMGQFYKIQLMTEEGVVEFRDSLKLIPLPIEKFAATFGLPETKGEIDYSMPRSIGYEPTELEWDYLRRDIDIMRRGLLVMFGMEISKLTIGSSALAYFKEITGPKRWEYLFPKLSEEIDKALRPAYKGGYCYAKESIRGKDIGSGMVADRNSMYPAVMRYKPFPVGMPVYFKGEYEADSEHPLYIQRFSCRFELREGFLPTIQDKSSGLFSPTEYLHSNEWIDDEGYPVNEPMVLTLTNLDLALFFEHYHVYDVEYYDGWKFEQAYHIFDDYIDTWYKVKEDAAKLGNPGMKQCAKLMLNNLYGKFASRIEAGLKEPYLEDGVVKYHTLDPEHKDPVYLPVGIFITAYARDCVIRAGQANYDVLCYIDTDSLHVMGDTIQGIELDPYKLGAWDIEGRFDYARFLRAKTYMEHIMEPGPEHFNIKCAGMPKGCHQYVTWVNFHVGTEYPGKLTYQNVKGGQVLLPTTFQIKA